MASNNEKINMNEKPELVDLGLSVKWMKCNLGAKSETDYGLYYQWGDIQGYSDVSNKEFTWNDYKLSGGMYLSRLKYSAKYGDDVLRAEDDAVTAVYGKGYRMPTEAEFDELLTLKKELVLNYKNSGKNGVIFYGKGSGEGNTLFFPAADTLSDGRGGDYDRYGFVWSSSPDRGSDTYAFGLYFDFDENELCTTYGFRADGKSVRGVSVTND